MAGKSADVEVIANYFYYSYTKITYTYLPKSLICSLVVVRLIKVYNLCRVLKI